MEGQRYPRRFALSEGFWKNDRGEGKRPEKLTDIS